MNDSLSVSTVVVTRTDATGRPDGVVRRYHSRIDRRAPGRVIVDAEGLMVRARESARLHPVQLTLHDDGQVEQRLSDGSVRPIALNAPLLLRPAPKVAGAGTLPLPHTEGAPVPSRPSMAPEQAGGRSRFVTDPYAGGGGCF